MRQSLKLLVLVSVRDGHLFTDMHSNKFQSHCSKNGLATFIYQEQLIRTCNVDTYNVTVHFEMSYYMYI